MRSQLLVSLGVFAGALMAHDLYIMPGSFRATPGQPLRVAARRSIIMGWEAKFIGR